MINIKSNCKLSKRPECVCCDKKATQRVLEYDDFSRSEDIIWTVCDRHAWFLQNKRHIFSIHLKTKQQVFNNNLQEQK